MLSCAGRARVLGSVVILVAFHMENCYGGRKAKSERVCFMHDVPVWLETMLHGELGVVGPFDYS